MLRWVVLPLLASWTGAFVLTPLAPPASVERSSVARGAAGLSRPSCSSRVRAAVVRQRRTRGSRLAMSEGAEMDPDQMRVAEIKAELDVRGVSYVGCFEKHELTKLLADARLLGKADPKVLEDFSKESQKASFDADFQEGVKKASDPETLKQMTDSEGKLPGGFTPEMMQKAMSNPELMGLLQNPKMQGIMKEVMTSGPEGFIKKFSDDAEAMEMMGKLSSVLVASGLAME